MNSVTLIGNLGADPEVRQVGETTKGRLRLATSERQKVDGEWQRVSVWHTIILWGRTAEVAEQYLRKGGKVAIRGRIAYNSYTDKNGMEKTSTEIVADELELLSGREEQSQDERPAQRQSAPQRQAPQRPAAPQRPTNQRSQRAPARDLGGMDAEDPNDLPF
jgi:single-strand DNA-binding protein